MSKWPNEWPLLELLFTIIAWIPFFHEKPEGQVYLEAIARAIAESGQISRYNSAILSGTPYDDTAIKEILREVFEPIAEGEVEVDEEIMPYIPRSTFPIMTIHQAKGLEFPLVIVDYKAARRPPILPTPNHQKDYWQIEAWQVQTYAWLRSQQPTANPVKAGILVYINELSPSQSELDELKTEIAQSRTDILPKNGSSDYYALYSWQHGSHVPSFTHDFLLERAIRIVPVDSTNVNRAVSEIDKAVGEIEMCALKENASGIIPGNWDAVGDDKDCDACDFRRFCPSPSQLRRIGSKKVQSPSAPG